MKLFYFMMSLAVIPFCHSDVLSRNITANANKITIAENYSAEKNYGLIHVKLCATCDTYKLTLDANTVLILNGKDQPTSTILRTRLTQPSKAVRIQYNNEDNSVSYIRWNPVAVF
ncbi:MAG: hypothetical protein ACI978_001477 [Oleispira sp.]|jgi:hypothetical protein